MALVQRSILVLADTQGDSFHIGDEAILAANLARLRASEPDVEVTVLGRRHDTADMSRALAGADAALISGGGNLSSTWPDLLAQRVFLMREATRLGRPVVTGGQTIGPNLFMRERSALADGLAGVGCLGVRELASATLALELGMPHERLVYQVDDAFALEAVEPADRALALEPFLAVTLDPSFGVPAGRVGLGSIASQLGEFAVAAGLRVVFLPHVGPLYEVGMEDGAIGEALCDRLRGIRVACALAPVLPPEQAAWVTQRAAAVVSSRFHPLVFASAAAVPCLGLYRDDYTRIKLQGALTHVGTNAWTLPVADAESGALGPALSDLWARREAVAATMAAARSAVDRREERRWQMLLVGLGLREADAAEAALDRPAAELASAVLESVNAEHRAGAAAPPRWRPERVSGFGATSAGNGDEKISDEQWDAFSRNGFMPLGQVLDETELEALRRRADDLALGVVANEHVLMQLDTGGAYEELPDVVGRFEQGTMRYRKIQGLENDDVFWPLVSRPLFLDVCARSYGPHAPVSIFRAMVMNKPAGQGTVLPWHQDGGDVWALDRDPLVTIWVALDPATTANGCLEVVRGSHRGGLVSAQGSTLSDADAARHCDPERVIPLEVEAGHAVALHNWLIHRSGVNPSPAPRRAFTGCYMDGRTLSTLTGDRFPVIHGAITRDRHEFVEEMQRDRAALRESFATCEEYALSLVSELETLQAAHRELAARAEVLEQERERLASNPRVDLGSALRRPVSRARAVVGRRARPKR